MIYGAIIGDMVGSRFEFDRGGLTKQFTLLTEESRFTDDTVMTVALADAMSVISAIGMEVSLEDIKTACTMVMQMWGRQFPNAGYGYRFYDWVMEDAVPYGSFGNGSAMRVSCVGWLFDSLEETRAVARATAEISHNHPEGIKGAECTAAIIYMARNGFSKKEIAGYVADEFGYNLAYSVDEWRLLHKHVETCMDSMPKAIAAFLEGRNYTDVIRNAVSLGGDTDTLAAIAGSMAEAMYGIPAKLKWECLNRLPKSIKEAVEWIENTDIKILVSKPLTGDAPHDIMVTDRTITANKED